MSAQGQCPGCGHRVALPGLPAGEALLACPACGTLFPLGEGERRRVVVAHESEEFLATAARVLDEGGFQPVVAADGPSARTAVAEHAPAALVVDVALPGALAFQWIPELRRASNGSSLRVVLVASVYDRTAYKRRPTDLHGADDYIEQHHVPDSLVDKLVALLDGRAPPPVHRPGRTETPREAFQARQLEEAAHRRERDRAGTGPLGVARLVIADLALYEGTTPEAAARASAREEIRRRLGDGIDDAAVDAALAQALSEISGSEP